MKPLTQIFFLIIFLAGIVIAQDQNSITGWVALERSDDEFSVRVPTGFTYLKDPFENRKYEARGEFHSDAERFYIFVDLAKKNESQRRQVENFLRSTNQATSAFGFSGLEGSKAEFKDATGYYHRVFFVNTPTRTFSLHTVSRHEDSEDAIRFLNSFRLISNARDTSAPVETIFTLKPKVEAEIPKPAAVPITKGSGSGSGSGNGPDTGNGVGSGSAVTSTSLRTTHPLKVLSKKKAEYTNFARFYMIQGTVTLRVTFMASGQIGSVVKIKSLPFGLTESAIEAAKLIRFEAEKVNDIAPTTSRPVVYQFSIY